MKRLVGKDYWENNWSGINNQKQDYNEDDYPADLLKTFLPVDSSKSLIEVGCVPGRNMIYFAKTFGYQVTGIDYVDEIKEVQTIAERNDVENITLIQEDFFNFKPDVKYDVVISLGFVEHFDKPEPVFEKHYDLLKEDGFLIIVLPNMRYMQKNLRIFFGAKRDFETHNLDVMLPDIWGKLAKDKGLSILYCDYIYTFDFWLSHETNRYLRRTARIMSKLCTLGLRMLRLDNIPNRFFSPYILLIAKKI